MEFIGLFNYLTFTVTLVCIYSILCLGLNVHWGYTGMLNIGIAAFFAVGAYTSAMLTTPDSPNYIGGFDLPIPIAWVMAMVIAGVLAFAIGSITLNLRADYLAIASIGLAEIVRLFLKNEEQITNGVRGISGIPRPFSDTIPLQFLDYTTCVLYLLILGFIYLLTQRAYISPWGRVVRSIRENELATSASGKNVKAFRLYSFIFGSSLMGLAGAMYSQFTGFISPESFEPLFTTFLVWVMLISGGSGNNKGAILGALVIWTIWIASETISNTIFSTEFVTRAAYFRLFLIGLTLQIIFIFRPQGLLPEKTLKL